MKYGIMQIVAGTYRGKCIEAEAKENQNGKYVMTAWLVGETELLKPFCHGHRRAVVRVRAARDLRALGAAIGSEVKLDDPESLLDAECNVVVEMRNDLLEIVGFEPLS